MTAQSQTPTPPTSNGKGEVAAARSQSERDNKQAPRTRESGFGGLRLKLAVPGAVDGYHLFWANDDAGEVEQLLSEGFDFVTPEEVNMKSRTSHIVADSDVTADRVSRYVGKKDDGGALRAYLLKCPEAVWAEREQDRHAAADAWDQAIRTGRIESDSSRYQPKGTTTSIDTNFRKEYS